jgi:hypothetical protein
MARHRRSKSLRTARYFPSVHGRSVDVLGALDLGQPEPISSRPSVGRAQSGSDWA